MPGVKIECHVHRLCFGAAFMIDVGEGLLWMQASARHPEAKGKSWIFKKKEQMRRQGYSNIPVDTKYTGRKRKSRF